MGSHSVTCYPTQVNAPALTSASKLVLDLPTPEGWKAELRGNASAGSRTRDLSITSPTPYQYTTEILFYWINYCRSTELLSTFKRLLKTELFDIAYSEREHSV